jgi:predicted secreted protein
MTTSGFWSYGSALQLGDGGTPETFATIAEVKDITPPQLERDSIEMTSQDSSDGYREFIPGWRDGTELTFECNWLPSNTTHDKTTGMLADFNDNVNHNWKLILPDSVLTITFAGHITAFNGDLPLEEGANLSITVKISGKPVFDV